MKKKICMAFLGLMAVSLLTGCQETRESIEVQIKDGMTTTILETYAGETVEEMLAEAELQAGEKDEISPAVTEVVSDSGSEITISRYAKAEVIYDEGQPVSVELCGATVQDAITASAVTVDENDYIDTDTNRLLEDGMQINITKRAEIILNDGGKETSDITAAKTVQEYIDEKGITLSSIDMLRNDPDEAIEEGLKIIIFRVTQKEETTTESIAYTTKYENSSSMYKGQTSVKQYGQNGEKEITYRVTYVNGKEHHRNQIKEVVTKEPVNEIILQGTKQKAVKPKISGNGKKVVSKQYYDDCDGSGHGTCVITYSDGTTSVVNY